MNNYPVIMGCNIIALKKDGKNYGMTCAWAQMIGFDKLMMLIGSQSETGEILAPGDIVGVSGLASDQEKISTYIGTHHSKKTDKFKDIKYTVKDSAILIDGAKTQSICTVENIMHLKDLEEDNLVILRINESKNDENKEFLLYK